MKTRFLQGYFVALSDATEYKIVPFSNLQYDNIWYTLSIQIPVHVLGVSYITA